MQVVVYPVVPFVEWKLSVCGLLVEQGGVNVADRVDVRAVKDRALASEIEKLVQRITLEKVVELESLLVSEVGTLATGEVHLFFIGFV